MRRSQADMLLTGQLLTLAGHEGQLCFTVATCPHGNLLRVLLWLVDAAVKCVGWSQSRSRVSPVCYAWDFCIYLARRSPVNSCTLSECCHVFVMFVFWDGGGWLVFFFFLSVCIWICNGPTGSRTGCKIWWWTALVPKSLFTSHTGRHFGP